MCRISAVFMKAWLVTRYDDAVTVLRDPRISKDISSKMALRACASPGRWPTTC